jgi:hypothetical protein
VKCLNKICFEVIKKKNNKMDSDLEIYEEKIKILFVVALKMMGN